MKRTRKNLIKLLESEIVALRRMQDDYSKKGDFDLAERRKIQRWELENVVEMLKNQNEFDRMYALYVGKDAEYLNSKK